MATTHYKLKRKELRQPDEFVTLIENTRDWVTENWRQLAASGAFVLVSAIAVFAYYHYERGRDLVAADRFSAALNALVSQQYPAAEEQFAKLAADEPDRQVGKLARLYLANAFLADNNPAKARDALVAFLGDDHDPEFVSMALNNLAVAYTRLGDYQKAVGAYRQAASVPGPEQASAQLGVARSLEKAGDKQGAITAYRTYLAEHPYSEQQNDVLASLAVLGASSMPAPARAR